MEYTDKEKQILSMIEKTNFQHLSEKDLFTYASKLNELRPEVAAEVLAHYPELTQMIQSMASEYRGILDNVIASDDKSLEQVYSVVNKDLDADEESRREFYDFAEKVRTDLSKELDNPSLTEEERKDILDREMEIFRAVDKKDSEIRNSEMEKVHTAEKKDSEKRTFNWKLIGTASTLAVLVIGIGTTALGGKFDIKLPHNSGNK